MASAKDIMIGLEKHIVKETNELHQELYTNIKRDNPVDTGLSQDSWIKSDPITRVGEVAWIGNPVDYIIYLELGHSSQAPNGFIKKNIVQSLNRRK